MKTKLFLLMMCCIGTLSAQNKVTVVIDGIENVKGQLLAGLYSEADFLKKPTFGAITKVTEETATVVFENVPTGEYAVSVFHDENENFKMEIGTYGKPIEKYGVSNNVRNEMGPPTYNECKFSIEEDSTIYITLF